MKKPLLLLVLLLFAFRNNESDHKFNSFKEAFILDLWKIDPILASSLGYHNYDSILPVLDKSAIEQKLKFAGEKLALLHQFEKAKLSNNNKTDFLMIEDFLNGLQWTMTTERDYEWNPSVYNVSAPFAEMLNNKYDSLDTRLHNFGLKLKSVPAYYEAAKRNIKNPSKEHTELAISQNKGGITVFESELKEALVKSGLSEVEKKEITDRAAEAVKSINNYIEWLKTLDNKTPRSFRLGKDLYVNKFKYEIQSRFTPDQIYQKAILRKKYLHKQMAEIAFNLWSKYLGSAKKPTDTLSLIKQVIDKVSLKHVTADSFQNAIEKQIPELASFVKKKNLLYLDPSKPLIVRKEPGYMAGVAGASISAPGPYDKGGNTWYNVGSLSGWEAERAESYLREYNYYMLQILNIHEAIPGHYAQLVYSNQSPSIIKSVLANGAMIEGWAVYSELMMLENGYGDNSPEMWLMYYKWNLRSTCNTILDISVHTKNMSENEGLALLTKRLSNRRLKQKENGGEFP